MDYLKEQLKELFESSTYYTAVSRYKNGNLKLEKCGGQPVPGPAWKCFIKYDLKGNVKLIEFYQKEPDYFEKKGENYSYKEYYKEGFLVKRVSHQHTFNDDYCCIYCGAEHGDNDSYRGYVCRINKENENV